MLDEQMQASKKEARDLEQSLSFALNEYLKSNVYRPGYGQQQQDDLEMQSRSNTKKLEQEVSTLLDRMSYHIDRMESMGSTANQSISWKAQISRLRDVLNSSTAEFRKTREKIKHREESEELLRNAKAELGGGLGEQNEEDRLYEQEREGIHSSMRMMDESIGKALALQDTLRLQSNRLRRATAGLSNMAESIPGINQLIKAAGRKKTRDNMIVAAFIAMFVCFTLWWMVNA